jgi:hypothetical protein
MVSNIICLTWVNDIISIVMITHLVHVYAYIAIGYKINHMSRLDVRMIIGKTPSTK